MDNSMSVENRSQVLDVAKAIGILFVIFAHVNYCEPFGRVLNNGFLFVITGISGTISVLVLSHFLHNSKLLKFYGKNSFTIMGCHYLIFQEISHILAFGNSKISAKIPIHDYDNLLDGVLMFFLVSLLSGVFVLLYNKCILMLDFKREKLKANQ